MGMKYEYDETERAAIFPTPAPAEVWVMDMTAEWDADYVGWQSVHATRAGALRRLRERLDAAGLPVYPELTTPTFPPAFTPGGADRWLAYARADDGSMSGDFEANGAAVSVAIHRMPVES